MILSREEKKVRRACDHHWNWKGHGHNDDAYECPKCGDWKFE